MCFVDSAGFTSHSMIVSRPALQRNSPDDVRLHRRNIKSTSLCYDQLVNAEYTLGGEKTFFVPRADFRRKINRDNASYVHSISSLRVD